MRTEAVLPGELKRFFNRFGFLETALTHSSRSGEDNSERLEFLGDAVIELVVRRYLLEQHPHASEGELTRMKIGLVRGDTLARCADRLSLRSFIRTGREFSETAIPDSMAADAYEAVAGAVFLDSGLQGADAFLRETLLSRERESSLGDPKSRLQEYCQALHRERPQYLLEETTGAPHAPVFRVGVEIEGVLLGRGEASSRKNAEMAAAAEALKALEGEEANGLHA